MKSNFGKAREASYTRMFSALIWKLGSIGNQRGNCNERSWVKGDFPAVARKVFMNKVTIELDSKWLKVIRSPKFKVVAALQGVSVTFAPLFLYWSGKDRFFNGFGWVVGLLCFAVIYFVGSFYIRLGGAVIRELIRHSPSAGS